MNFTNGINPKAYADLIQKRNRLFSEEVCLAPFNDHQGPIIASHTLSVSSMLAPIAEDSHVLRWKVNAFSQKDEDFLKLQKFGIYQASTFNGFCQKHDKSLFSPIEDRAFICSPQQLFTLAYRPVAREAYLKIRHVKSVPTPEELDSIRTFSSPIAKETMLMENEVRRFYAAKGAEDALSYKDKFDLIAQTQEYHRLISWVLPFSSKPGLVCSGSIFPEFDFLGNRLQSLSDFKTPLETICVSIIPSSNGGIAILSFLDTETKHCERFVKSLLAQSDLTSSLVWFILSSFENVAISPSWWKTLSTETQKALTKGIRHMFDETENIFHSNPISITSWGFNSPFRI